MGFVAALVGETVCISDALIHTIRADFLLGLGAMTDSTATAISQAAYTPTSNSFKTGIRGLCPLCQRGHIFNGYLQVAKQCDVCGLDYSFSNTADGPAFFAMSIIAPFAMGLALWLELAYEVPVWVHLLTTLPFTVLGCIFFLRPLKGWLLSAEYVHGIRDGRIKLSTTSQG